LSENFLREIQNFGLKNPILWKSRCNVEGLSTYINSVRNLQLNFEKLQLSYTKMPLCRIISYHYFRQNVSSGSADFGLQFWVLIVVVDCCSDFVFLEL